MIKEIRYVFMMTLILLFSSLTSWTLSEAYSIEAIDKLMWSEAGGGNALLLSVALILGLLIFYLSLRKGIRYLKLLIWLSSLTSLYLSIQVYIYAALRLSGLSRLGEMAYVASVLTSILLSLLAFELMRRSKGGRLTASLVSFYTTTLGSLMGLVLTFPELLMVVTLASIADVFSVFKGPISKLFYSLNSLKEVDSALKGALIPLGDVRVGAGDIIFYSMIISSTYKARPYNYLLTLTALLAILSGVYLTMRGLRRRRVLPALPLPAALSLTSLMLLSRAIHCSL